MPTYVCFKINKKKLISMIKHLGEFTTNLSSNMRCLKRIE